MKSIKQILLCLIIGTMMIGCTLFEQMNVITQELQFEYGTPIDLKLTDFLDNSTDLLDQVQSENDFTYLESLDYPEVGEYTLTLKYKNKLETVNIIISDTIAPSFIDLKDTYRVDYGKSFDKSVIKVDDYSKVVVTVNDEHVDYKKAGTYDVDVIACDDYNNQTKATIQIIVLNQPVVTTQTSQKVNTTQSTNQSQASTSQTSSTGTPSLQKQVMTLINQERTALGLSPVVWDAECERVAKLRVKQIQTDFSHSKFYSDFYSQNNKLGETLAYQAGGTLTAQGAFQLWMNSSSHKAILMNPNRTKIAIVSLNNRFVAINSLP